MEAFLPSAVTVGHVYKWEANLSAVVDQKIRAFWVLEIVIKGETKWYSSDAELWVVLFKRIPTSTYFWAVKCAEVVTSQMKSWKAIRKVYRKIK